MTATGSPRYPAPVEIRAAAAEDWPGIYPFYSTIMNEGRTYAFPEGQTLDQARPWWMERPPGQTVVAVEGGTIVGSAKMGQNRPGRGAHVATASFIVDPAHRVKGVGRALGQYVIDWSRAQASARSSSTPSSRSTTRPCTCGSRSGSRSSAPCPSPSITPSTGSSACT